MSTDTAPEVRLGVDEGGLGDLDGKSMEIQEPGTLEERMAKAAEKYGLHTCRHCQKFVLDFRKFSAALPLEELGQEIDLDEFVIPSSEVFTAVDEECDLFVHFTEKIGLEANRQTSNKLYFTILGYSCLKFQYMRIRLSWHEPVQDAFERDKRDEVLVPRGKLLLIIHYEPS